jgi:esterase
MMYRAYVGGLLSYLSQFHHKLQGNDNGPKLVFLHGLMGYAGNWMRITPAFENKFHILTYDQRGHGRSMKPEHGYSPEDYASDLVKILDELGWSRVNLVGHSMGGRNAMSFASQYPERVERLVIEDIGPDANQAAVARIHKLLEGMPTPFKEKRTAKDFLMNNISDPALGMYLYSNLEEKPDGSFDWRFSKKAILESVDLGRAKERWDQIKSFAMPTLIVRGENSEEFPKEVFEKIGLVNPKIERVEIKNSGHWVHFDQPDEFIRVLQEFLE